MPPLAVEISSRRVGGLLMAIANHGWEFNVRRLGLHKRGPQVRTYGTYEVFIDGVSAATTNPLLKGNVCEVTGPGKNHPQNNGLRIEAGRYQLTTQFGQRYESIGYSTDTQVAAKLLMPGIGLVNTGQRIGILIHPGHPKHEGDVPPVAYVSSVGCFNPTQTLTAQDDIEFFESRLRVIALIDSLAAFAPAVFHNSQGKPIRSNTIIPGAFANVDGEPMNDISTPTLVS
jgi:hypothetical protein